MKTFQCVSHVLDSPDMIWWRAKLSRMVLQHSCAMQFSNCRMNLNSMGLVFECFSDIYSRLQVIFLKIVKRINPYLRHSETPFTPLLCRRFHYYQPTSQ